MTILRGFSFLLNNITIVIIIVITFDVNCGGDWLGFGGGTRRDPEATSREGHEREPRLKVVIVIIPPKHWWWLQQFKRWYQWRCWFMFMMPVHFPIESLRRIGAVLIGGSAVRLGSAQVSVHSSNGFNRSFSSNGWSDKWQVSRVKKLKSFLPTPALGIYCFADHEIGYFLSGFDLAIILLCCLFFLRLVPCWKLNYLLCSSGVQRRSEEEVGGGSKEKVRRRGCCSYEEPLFRPQTHALIQRDKHRQRQRQRQRHTPWSFWYLSLSSTK